MKEILLNDKIKELRFSLIFRDAQEAESEFSKVAAELKARGASVVSLEVFAAKWAQGAVKNFSKDFDDSFPINWICPLDATLEPVLASAHVIALEGAQVESKKTADGNVAVKYSDGFANYIKTFGIKTSAHNDDGYLHTLANLNELEGAIALFDCKYTDIARTWFYNDDILAWYPEFNKARTEFYQQRNIFEMLLPASTGIGAPNPSGVKISSGALALLPTQVADGYKVFELESPLQCGAPQYGSSFSRAIEIDTPRSRRIMISGTASIEPEGATAHVGDIEKQVDLTMRVIEEILRARDMELSDTVHCVVYCLRPEYYAVYKNWMKARNLESPNCPAFSIVCRDDLLFEVELEAVKAR